MMHRTMRATAWLGLAIACGVSTVAVMPAAEGTPQSAAEAVAIATRLAKAAGPGGQAVCASRADQLAIIPAEWIVPCLAAFADATPAGANWLRSGLERAVDKAGAGLSADSLAAVVADVTQPPRVRALAFAWLKERDQPRADGLLGAMLDDRSLDLRREAVEKQLAAVSSGDEAAQKVAYRRCLVVARDVDQIERIAGWLSEHGEPVDVAKVLGFVRRWRVSEAYDNA